MFASLFAMAVIMFANGALARNYTCESILADGILETERLEYDEALSKAYLDLQCTTEMKLHKEVHSAGIGIGVPFQGQVVEADGEINSKAVSEWQKEHCRDVKYSMSHDVALSTLRRHASAHIVDAWQACKKYQADVALANQSGLLCEVVAADRELLQVSLTNTTPPKLEAGLKVVSSFATGVRETEVAAPGTSILRDGRIITLHRQVNKQGDSAAATISVTAAGGAKASCHVTFPRFVEPHRGSIVFGFGPKKTLVVTSNQHVRASIIRIPAGSKIDLQNSASLLLEAHTIEVGQGVEFVGKGANGTVGEPGRTNTNGPHMESNDNVWIECRDSTGPHAGGRGKQGGKGSPSPQLILRGQINGAWPAINLEPGDGGDGGPGGRGRVFYRPGGPPRPCARGLQGKRGARGVMRNTVHTLLDEDPVPVSTSTKN